MDWDTVQAWCSLVFDGRDAAEFVELRAIPSLGGSPHREFVRDWRGLQKTIADLEDRQYNIYMGIATRRHEGGKKSDMAACDVAWIDIDWKTEEQQLEAIQHIKGFARQPSFTVSSGGGIHLYWSFAEPMGLERQEEIDEFECLLKGLAEVLHGDKAATDVGRIMRVAGTTNWPDERKRKDGRVPKETVLDETNSLTVYEWKDFDDLVKIGESLMAPKAEEPTVSQTFPTVPERVDVELRRGGGAYKLFVNSVDEEDNSKVDWQLACKLARHNKLTFDDISETLRASREYRRCAGHKDEQYYPRTVRKAFAEVNREIPPDPVTERGRWVRYVLRSQQDAVSGTERVALDLDNVGDSPRWDCCIPELKFYGVSVVSGPSGVGKSTLAITAGVEAACGDWDVLYFNSELSVQRFNTMLGRYVETASINIDRLSESFQHVVVQPGVGRDEIVQEIVRSVPENPVPRVLVILDSLNSLAALSGSTGGWDEYIPTINWLSMWAMSVRRETGGDVSFLIVSELNVRQELVGRRLQYLADLVLTITPSEIENDFVFNVVKGRETGKQDLGAHTLDWRWSRFDRSGMFDEEDEDD